MPCNPILLGAFADGELHGVRAWQLRRHLAHCPICQQEMAELEALSAELKSISPLSLPSRQPVSRPIGLVRPAFATLALASVATLCLAPHPTPTPEVPPQVVEGPVQTPIVALPAPKALLRPQQVARQTEKAALRPRRVALRHKRVSRRTAKIRRRFEAAPEQIIVVASRPTPPQPVTVVLNDKDDQGGTIHIESTIPAAYVVALQKEKL